MALANKLLFFFNAHCVYVCMLCVCCELQNLVQYNERTLLPLAISNAISMQSRSPFLKSKHKHKHISLFLGVLRSLGTIWQQT